jgi:hypothetical protein
VAAVDLDQFFTRIMPEVSRAPTDFVRQQLIDVLREFCKATRCWQEPTNDVDITVGQASYAITPPITDAVVVAAEFVSVDGAESIPKGVEFFDRYYADWRTRDGDDFRYFTADVRGTILFPGKPTAAKADALDYRASFMPSQSATEIEERIYDEWFEEVANGVKARMLAMTSKPWADLKRADICQNMYLSGRGRARIAVSKRYGNVQESFLSVAKFAGR